MQQRKNVRQILIMILSVIISIAFFSNKAEAYSNRDIDVSYVEDYTASEEVKNYLSVSSPKKVKGLSWDAKNGILTLNGYDGGAIYISRAMSYARDKFPQIKIQVTGKNIIHANTNANQGYGGILYINDIDVTFIGNGSIYIDTFNEGEYGYNLTVFGNMTLDGPTIVIPNTNSAIWIYEGNKYIDNKPYPMGGNLTVKSGRIQMDMHPYISPFQNGSGTNKEYVRCCAVSVKNELKISGGSFAFDMDWSDVAATYTIKPFGVFDVQNKIEVSNASVLVRLHDDLSRIPVFLVYLRDAEGFTQHDSDGTCLSDPNKVIIDDSVTIFKNKKGDIIDISNMQMSLSEEAFEYDGTEKKPTVSIKGLTEGVDFTVKYTNNVNPGKALVTVTGIGNFEGTLTKTFNIREPKTENSEDSKPQNKQTTEEKDKNSKTTEKVSENESSNNTVPSKGSIIKIGYYKYKITKTATKKSVGTVTLLGVANTHKSKIKSLVIPATISKNGYKYKVTSVGAKAFKGCKNLKKLTLGSNISTIETNAFSGCKKLSTVSIKTTKIRKIGKRAFYGISKNAKFKYPKMSKAKKAKLVKMVTNAKKK